MKTPGQIAYEKFDKGRKAKGDYAAIKHGTFKWDCLSTNVQETWEDVAAAVIKNQESTDK